MTEPRILILCTGNICRSCFAEIALRRHLAAHDLAVPVRSAGTVAVPGRHSPDEAVAAAAAFDIDLTVHRARLLDASMLAACSHLIAMEDEHLEAATRVTDGELRVAWTETWGVADPYGLPLAEYERCYVQLDELCAEFAAELAEGR